MTLCGSVGETEPRLEKDEDIQGCGDWSIGLSSCCK